MKKTVITLSVLTCLAIAALIFKPMAEPSKQNILHKKHATHGFTKPRSTFVIHRLPSKSENSISLSLEVAGPFDHYEFNWWMPDSTQITSGDSNGTVDASTQKNFTHEIEFAGLNQGEQIVFEAHLIEDGNKLGATYIYTYGDAEPSLKSKSLSIQKIESTTGSKIKVMQ